MRSMHLAVLLVGLDMPRTTDVRLLRSKVVFVKRMEGCAAVAAHVRVFGRRPHSLGRAKLRLAEVRSAAASCDDDEVAARTSASNLLLCPSLRR